MTRIRRFALFAVAAILSTMASPANADGTGMTPPFASTFVEKHCGMAAIAASPTDCDGSATASKSTGAVSSEVHLISPLGGKVPWLADAYTNAFVNAPAYHLAHPVPRLDFTVTVHVNSASATLTGPQTGFEDQGVAFPFQWVGAFVFGGASHNQCSDCVGGADDIALLRLVPGTTSVANQNFTLHFWVKNTQGKDVPAGDVIVQGGVGVVAWQYPSSGAHKVTIDAVVTSISID